MVWTPARPARKLLLLPLLDADQASVPGISSAEDRVDHEPAPGMFTDWAEGSGTDSSSPEEGLLGSTVTLDCFEIGTGGPMRVRNSGEA